MVINNNVIYLYTWLYYNNITVRAANLRDGNKYDLLALSEIYAKTSTSFSGGVSYTYELGDKSPSGRETCCVCVCERQQQYILLEGVFFYTF